MTENPHRKRRHRCARSFVLSSFSAILVENVGSRAGIGGFIPFYISAKQQCERQIFNYYYANVSRQISLIKKYNLYDIFIKEEGNRMKRTFCIIVCFIMILSLCACKADDTIPLHSGYYYAAGDYGNQSDFPKLITPYLELDTESQTFRLGQGVLLSFSVQGTYKIKNNKIIAASQFSSCKISSYTFEIKDSETVILINCKDHPKLGLPIGTEFIYSEEDPFQPVSDKTMLS